MAFYGAKSYLSFTKLDEIPFFDSYVILMQQVFRNNSVSGLQFVFIVIEYSEGRNKKQRIHLEKAD